MPEVIDKDKILKSNPHIDKDKLEESLALTQKLVASGTKISRYNLVSPYSRRRIKERQGEYACKKHGGNYRKT